MLYGYPGSGKTYFARQLCDNLQAALVQSDRIRTELFENPRYDAQETAIVSQLSDYMAQEFLNAGLSVVYDANAMRSSQRLVWRDMARRAGAHPLLVWFQIDADSAYVRSAKRDRRKADDKYAAPMDKATFEKIITHMQNPASNEDYIVVSGKHVFTTQIAALMKRLHDLNLIPGDAVSQRVAKPGMVNLVPNPAAGRVDMSRRNVIIR